MFLRIEGLWPPCVEQVYQRIFPTAFGSLRVSESHFGNSHDILDFFIVIMFVMVIFDVTIAKRLQLTEGLHNG